MAYIPLLRTRGAYAIACQVYPDKIIAQLLCLNGEQQRYTSMLDPRTGDCYPVELPLVKGAEYDVTLSIRK